MVEMPIICNRMNQKKKKKSQTNLRKMFKISNRNFTKYMGCNNNKITTLNSTFWLFDTLKISTKNVHYQYVLIRVFLQINSWCARKPTVPMGLSASCVCTKWRKRRHHKPTTSSILDRRLHRPTGILERSRWQTDMNKLTELKGPTGPAWLNLTPTNIYVRKYLASHNQP